MHSDNLYQFLDACICVYNHADNTVTEIWCYQQCTTIMDTVKDDLDVKMNYTAAREHNSVTNKDNNKVKDSTRSIFHSLPFRMIPKLMVSKLNIIATKLMN